MIFFISDLIFKSRVKEILGDTASIFGKNLEELSDSPWAAELQSNPATVVVVDMAFKREDPLLLIREIRKKFPENKIIAFGAHVDPDALKNAKENGANEVMANSGFMNWLAKDNQKGAGFWTVLVFGAIFSAGLWYLFHLIPVYYRYYELENAMHSIIKVSKELSPKEFRKRLITQMKDIGTPGDYSSLQIDKAGESVRLQYSYGEAISFTIFEETYTVQRFFFSLDVDARQHA